MLGRAGTGKTTAVMQEIKERMNAGESGLLLVVPEQYSHDAEKRLCAVCGDGLSLHGETLSFTGLCRLVFSETGGADANMPDAAGAILLMHRAFESVAPRLKAFGARGLRTNQTKMLLSAVNELKSMRVTPETLERIGRKASNPLAEKLSDLALIAEAYNAMLSAVGGDKSDRLSLLAEMIVDSTVGDQGSLFFDGFNDFTEQELYVIEKLLQKNAEMTVCLTCDPREVSAGGEAQEVESGEVFELPRKTAGRLSRLAGENGVEVRMITPGAKPEYKAPELVFLEKRLFGYSDAKFHGGELHGSGPDERRSAITIYAAPTRIAECEHAAYKVWALVRAGYRWRDIGVMARNWDEYGPICETVFEKYGVPFFSGGRADILDKPPAALICAALEVAASGWEYRPVFRYIKTGLTEIPADDYSELENYVIKWDIRGSMWTRDWTLPPSGFGGEEDAASLSRLNRIRQQIAQPLARLRSGIKGVTAVSEKLLALYEFLEETGFSKRLAEKSEELDKRGELRLAGEYLQLLDIIMNAIEQMHGILGGNQLSASEFVKLFTLALSQYNVSVIPVSLDRTTIGGMAMSRRRDLKCLIILGATDSSLPMLSKGSGALSDSERDEMAKLGAGVPSGFGERLHREMNMLYSTVTLPSHELILTYPTDAGERPSSIIKRIKSMFGVNEVTLRDEEYMAAAETPCLELAAYAGAAGHSAIAAAARDYFSGFAGCSERLIAADAARSSARGGLSDGGAERLYGRPVSLSATRVDRYYSCPYMHFLQNGLKLNPRVPAAFDAPLAGVFMHYVLEEVAREIKATAGFKNAGVELCRDLTTRYIEKYIHEKLFDFEGVNARFVYLFRRLGEDVLRIVLDMLDEMKHSDFEPIGFELDLSKFQESGQEREGLRDGVFSLKGIVDRVDGWQHGGKMYMRVIDYKTGAKSFDLSDVLRGRNMQMLIYLFALQKIGGNMYGAPIAPSGVLYVPARDVILKASRNATDEEISRLREKLMRRDGLVLNDSIVLEAMENGGAKKYLPVKTAKDGSFTGDSLVSEEQIELLSDHVEHMLGRAVEEILGGGIDRRPYYKNDRENACHFCEYRAVCRFDEDSGDRPGYARKLKTGEAWALIGNKSKE